jgi:ankyrin repeat protein
MICPDIFEQYDKLFNVQDKCISFNKDYKKNYNKDTFDNYLIYYIENKEPKRNDNIKKYIQMGFDINEQIKKIKMTWIEFACLHNDIPLVGTLVKSGANIHILDSNNFNLISKCVINQNTILLKYFLNLGVDPNILNKENGTPLLISCIMKDGFACGKILLEHSATKIDTANLELPITELIINKINSGQKEYLELLKLLLKKKIKINSNDMMFIRKYTISNKLDIIKVYGDIFPNIVNKSSDDEDKETIVNYALHEEYNEMLEYFFNIKDLDYRKTNIENINYLEYLCGFQMFEMLDLFCKKFPKSLDLTYNNSMGIVENVILIYDFECLNNVELDAVKKTIKILVSNGANINHRNKSGYTPIFPSIQYSTPEFVEFMIKQGANIKEPLIKNREFPPVSNNDPISFAIQLNKFDILKVLINLGGLFHQIDINGLKFYTSILICLKYKRQIHFDYIIKNIPEVSTWLKSDNLITNFLFDYAIKNCCLDELMLKEIVPEFKIKSLDFSDPNLSISHNENKISMYVDEYKNLTNKLVILNGILETVRILSKLSNLSNKNYTGFYSNFENLYGSIFGSLNSDSEIKNIYNNFYDWVDVFINVICNKIDYYNMHNIKKIFEYVCKLYWEIPDDEDDEDDEQSNFNSNKFVPKQYVKKINNIYKLFEFKKTQLDEYEKDLLLIIDKYINSSSDNIIVRPNKKMQNQNIVIKKLFKLFWPEKQSHYEYMYDCIVNNDDKIVSDGKNNKINSNLIVVSKNKIKATIFYNSDSSIPPRWIKTYAPNIGKEEKNDLNHMFPFALDNLLEKFPCVSIETKDPNHNGNNLLCYYNGIIEFNNKIEIGCYEYFINSNGTLFHRMFRPWSLLPNNVKKMLKN